MAMGVPTILALLLIVLHKVSLANACANSGGIQYFGTINWNGMLCYRKGCLGPFIEVQVLWRLFVSGWWLSSYPETRFVIVSVRQNLVSFCSLVPIKK